MYVAKNNVSLYVLTFRGCLIFTENKLKTISQFDSKAKK